MKTALLLIDVQESFRQRACWNDRAAETFLLHCNALVEGSVKSGVPVVRILHADGPAAPDNPFSLASGHVRPLKGLSEFAPAAEFYKTRHSSLVGTGLPVWLRENGIDRLIIAGIRTEQCCEATTRHASDEGFEVDYVTDATLTFDMHHLDGTLLPAADIKARTAAVLSERFATICNVEQALARTV
jgi:nicotinamidase-related amidase